MYFETVYNQFHDQKKIGFLWNTWQVFDHFICRISKEKIHGKPPLSYPRYIVDLLSDTPNMLTAKAIEEMETDREILKAHVKRYEKEHD